MRNKIISKYPLLLSLMVILLLSSCYSSTAVKGIPVNQVDLKDDQNAGKVIMTREKLKALKEMSNVTQNSTFLEINGFPEFRIGPLDVLEISSHVGEKRTTTVVTVNNRGFISYSFLDDLNVMGMTPSHIDDLITEKLSAYVRKPRIDVFVKDFQSKVATIIGELSSLRSTTSGKAASGRINLKGKTTLMDLLALAGGYTVDADIKNIKLVRNSEGYIINVYDIIERGDATQNIIIENGDVINVPELPQFGERVYVMGEVNSQGIYPLKDAQDLLAAISLAGSFTRLAKEENTLIVREYEKGKKPLVMMSDLNALLRKADLSQNLELRDGDLIYVPRMLIGDINDWIANTKPLLDFLFYPKDLQDQYFLRNYLHLDRYHHK